MKKIRMSNEKVRALINEEVTLPAENVCDIIIREDDMDEKEAYVNLMSGKRGGMFDVIRKNIHYVWRLSKSVEYFIENYRGVYAIPSKQIDALIILCCVLKKQEDGTYHWVEEKCEDVEGFTGDTIRTFLSKSYVIHTRSVGFYMRDFNHKEIRLVDIYGNVIYDGRQSTSEPTPFGLKNTLLDYLGNVIVTKTGIKTDGMVLINRLIWDTDDLRYGVKEYGRFPELGEIPADVKKRLSIIANDYDAETVYAYLQKTDAGFVQREFFAAKFSLGADPVFKFYEIQRTLFNAASFKKNTDFRPVMFWYDGYRDDSAEKPLSGTAQKLLDDYMDSMWGSIGKSDMNDIMRNFYVQTTLSPLNFTEKLCALSENKIAAAILNTDMHMTGVRRFFSEFTVTKQFYNPARLFKRIFGETDENGETIDEMLKIPEGMFEFVEGGECFSIIGKCKKLFGKHQQYFVSLDKKDYVLLIRILRDKSKQGLNTAAKLIDLSGQPGNWKLFLKV